MSPNPQAAPERNEGLMEKVRNNMGKILAWTLSLAALGGLGYLGYRGFQALPASVTAGASTQATNFVTTVRSWFSGTPAAPQANPQVASNVAPPPANFDNQFNPGVLPDVASRPRGHGRGVTLPDMGRY